MFGIQNAANIKTISQSVSQSVRMCIKVSLTHGIRCQPHVKDMYQTGLRDGRCERWRYTTTV